MNKISPLSVVAAPRVALFSGNYNYLRDGANRALNRLVDYLERQGVAVRVYSPTGDQPAFKHAGDLVSVRLRDAGYEVAICDNVHNNPELRGRLPDDHWLKSVHCDIAFDASGDPFYLHLGRGTLRSSKPGFDQARDLSLGEWLALVRSNLLPPNSA